MATKKRAKKKEQVKIAIILDSSASMVDIKDQAISMFNEHAAAARRKAENVDVKLSLITFNSNLVVHFMNADVGSIRDLNRDTYKPDGNTALYDAIGFTTEWLNHTDTGEGSYLVIVVTDGEENASRVYGAQTLSATISKLRETGRWTFVVAGANIDLAQLGATLGLDTGGILLWDSTAAGTRAMGLTSVASMERYLNNVASGKQTASYFGQ